MPSGWCSKKVQRERDVLQCPKEAQLQSYETCMPQIASRAGEMKSEREVMLAGLASPAPKTQNPIIYD